MKEGVDMNTTNPSTTKSIRLFVYPSRIDPSCANTDRRWAFATRNRGHNNGKIVEEAFAKNTELHGYRF